MADFRTILTAACVAILTAPCFADPTTRPGDEVAPVESLPCFPGAIYRKAISSMDVWTGIEAELVLPTLVTDPNRFRPTNGRPMDNASAYLGGNADEHETEIDAGVSWEVVREPDGTVSKIGKAFRPFWRNKKWFSGPAKPEFYYYPGDTIRLTCWTPAPDKLRIRFELLQRKDQPRPAEPISTHEAEFDAPGFAPGQPQQFKRVNAIDQFGNEGNPAQRTDARVDGLRWVSVTLSRGSDRRPMTADRFTDMRCPSPHMVRVTDPTDTGGERVDLAGR